MDRLISSDASNTAGRRTRVVLKPTILGNQFEVAAVRPPRALVHDLATIFPDIKEPQKLIVVPTVQRARLDLAAIGQEVEDEKKQITCLFHCLVKSCCWEDTSSRALGRLCGSYDSHASTWKVGTGWVQ